MKIPYETESVKSSCKGKHLFVELKLYGKQEWYATIWALSLSMVEKKKSFKIMI